MKPALRLTLVVGSALTLFACAPSDPKVKAYEPQNAPTASASEQALAAGLLREINALRSQAGRKPATGDPEMSAVARIHSRDMAAGLAPVSVAGRELRRQAAGLLHSQELVAARSGTAPDAARRFVAGWAADPAQQQALVQSDSRIGVGVAQAKNGLAYVTLILSGGGW